MKGKNIYTRQEIEQLRDLIRKRNSASAVEQKSIRQKMRKMGFWGRDDWGIIDCSETDLDKLIELGYIKLIDGTKPMKSVPIGRRDILPINRQCNVKLEKMSGLQSIEDVKHEGFSGFISVAKLREDGCSIPTGAGVYLVVRATKTAPRFLSEGTGGYFKGKNPNVSIEELQANWVDDTCVLYIGKATSLRKRLKQYIDFGKGRSVGHWGGRYIWQLEDADQLLLCWKETPNEDPKSVESAWISSFKSFYGVRPFANLQG